MHVGGCVGCRVILPPELGWEIDWIQSGCVHTSIKVCIMYDTDTLLKLITLHNNLAFDINFIVPSRSPWNHYEI